MSSSLPTEYWEGVYRSRSSAIPDIDANHSEADAVVDVWDNEVRLLASVVAKFNKSRNDLRRPVALPKEVLARIFEYTALIWPEAYIPWEPRWWPITEVCSRWRKVAIGHAPLWSTITLPHDGLPLGLIIKRSQTALLNITWTAINGPSCDSIIARLFHRTKALRLRGDFVAQCLPKGRIGPNLESLTITEELYEPSAIIPSSFIADHLSTLRHIVLTAHPFAWPSVFTNIQTLSLTTPPEHIRNMPPATLEEILNSLSNMPHLKYLSLRGVLPAVVEDCSSIVVHLPNLCELTLLGSCSSVTALHRSMDIPINTSVSLVYLDQSNQQYTLTHLSNWFKSPNLPRYKHLRINVERDYMVTHFTMQARSGFPQAKDSNFNRDSHSSPELVICIRVKGDISNLPRVIYEFAMIATAFPLESFCIKGEFIFWRHEKLKSFLARARTLKHIKYLSQEEPFLREDRKPYLLEVLVDDSRYEGSNAGFVCPSLETVNTIGRGLVFNGYDVPKLVDSLKRRESGGMGLQALHLVAAWNHSKSAVSDGVLALLKPCAREVVLINEDEIWNTYESDCSEFDEFSQWGFY